MRDLLVTLPDKRQVAFTDIGEAGWPCVMFFHGAPMSRLHLGYLEEQFLEQRIRAISPDRPGYGRSSPQPGRSWTDWPADVAFLASALEIDRFLMAGHSSGGSYAVACAAELPDRVAGGLLLDGVTDMAWPGAWQGYVESEAHLMKLPNEEAAVAWCVEHFGPDGANFDSAAGFTFGSVDEALMADERIGPPFQEAGVEAFRQGMIGYAQDVIVQARPWNFDPAGIVAPFEIVHGEADLLLPLTHSLHNAELIPGSTLRVLPGHGHLTTVSELPRLARSLADR